MPGSDLLAVIRAGRDNRRPVWLTGTGVPVPRLEHTHQHASRDARRLRFHEVTLRWLETPETEHLDAVLAHETARTQLRRLDVAAHRDLLGWPVVDKNGVAATPNIQEFFGYPDERQARRDLAAGRALWPSLSGWPWWTLSYFGHKGAAPRRWWEIEDMQRHFEAWLTDYGNEDDPRASRT